MHSLLLRHGELRGPHIRHGNRLQRHIHAVAVHRAELAAAPLPLLHPRHGRAQTPLASAATVAFDAGARRSGVKRAGGRRRGWGLAHGRGVRRFVAAFLRLLAPPRTQVSGREAVRVVYRHREQPGLLQVGDDVCEPRSGDAERIQEAKKRQRRGGAQQ